MADVLVLLALLLGRDGLGWVDIVPLVARLLDPAHLDLLQKWSVLHSGSQLRHAHELTEAAARLILGGLRCKRQGVARHFAEAVHEQHVFAALLDACRRFASVPGSCNVAIDAFFL